MQKSCLLPLLALVSLMASCITIPTVDPPRVQISPELKVGRTVIFKPTCRGAGGCPNSFSSTLVGRLTSELEFKGYQFIVGEELFAEARRRQKAGGQVTGDSPFGDYWIKAGGMTEQVLTYEDLPPAGKRALLEEAKADGVLVLNILVGEDAEPESFMYEIRAFEVTARYTMGPEEAPGWVARCGAYAENRKVVGSPGVTYAQAADKIARCLVSQLEQ